MYFLEMFKPVCRGGHHLIWHDLDCLATKYHSLIWFRVIRNSQIKQSINSLYMSLKNLTCLLYNFGGDLHKIRSLTQREGKI